MGERFDVTSQGNIDLIPDAAQRPLWNLRQPALREQ